MALVREVESLDDVPEYARVGYKQVGEKWINEDVEDVTGLRTTMQTERATRKTLEKEVAELRPFKELGMSAREIADQKAEIARLRSAGGSEHDVEKLIEKRLKQVRDEEFAPVVSERDALRNENRELKLTDKVRAAFLEAGGRKEDVDLAVLDTTKRFGLSDKGKVIVLDEEGDPTGETPKEWFEKRYKLARPNLFNGTSASGGGAQQGHGGTGGAEELAKLAPEERLSAARARGLK